MELRLANQQSHSKVAVLLGAVVIILSLVILNLDGSADPDPVVDLSGLSESSSESTSTSSIGRQAAPQIDGTSPGRSNAGFSLKADASTSTTEEPTTSTLPPVNAPETTKAVATSAPTTTVSTTTSTTSEPTTVTTTTVPPTTPTTLHTIIRPPSTFTLPTIRPWPTIIEPTITVTSATVDDGEDPPDSKNCRGNRPDCDDD